MTLPRSIGAFASHRLNPVIRPIVLRLPGIGLLRHTGRVSGRTYEIPMAGFRRNGTVTFALTYGPQADWVRNVVASGTCTFTDGSRTLTLVNPRLVHDPSRARFPRLVRLPLGLMRISDALIMDIQNERTYARL